MIWSAGAFIASQWFLSNSGSVSLIDWSETGELSARAGFPRPIWIATIASAIARSIPNLRSKETGRNKILYRAMIAGQRPQRNEI
jgi:hypothetical protein